MPLQAVLRTCEDLIRQGRDDEAQRLLRAVDLVSLPRALRLQFANLCRRSGLIAQGLRILTPVIRPKARSEMPAATDSEKSEYAMLLQRSGAVTEALSILDGIDSAQDPRVLLYQAFCHFNEWNYEAALPRLRQYLKAPLDPYPRLIARVNLIACLLTLRQFDEAVSEIDKAFVLAQELDAQRLRGNLFELRAQLHLAQESYKHASDDLNEAEKILGGIQNEDLLFVRKWRAVIDLQTTGRRAPLLQVQTDAERAGDWESAREARLFLLTQKLEHESYLELFVGTPFPGYRARIQEQLSSEALPDLPKSWRWGSALGPALDLATGELVDVESKNFTAPTAKCLMLIEVLSQDLFRPQRLATIFGRLFPTEYFDIFSSPQRVHQILTRTRRWLKQNNLPLVITETKGHFRLLKPENFALILTLSREPRENHHRQFEKLQRGFKSARFFTAPEAAEALGISPSQTKRLLAWGVMQSRLRRMGRGSGTTYSLSA